MKNLKKLTAIGLAILVTFTIVGYQEVSAEEANVDGHFYVANTSDSNSEYGWSYSSKTITISEDGDYTIEKACSCSNDTVHSSYSIVISGTVTVNLTIKDVMIKNTFGGAAMEIDGTSTVTLILEGDNSFASANYHAGIQFNNATTGSLTITSDSEDNTLTVKGGLYGAGIGGGDYASASNITLSGGTVYATGGDWAAGIGGGCYGSASNITLSGGTVTVTGGYSAAGIGGGWEGSASNIIISGGTVTATGGAGGAGIGGGPYASASDITISGGTVTAKGIGGGAGIGSGYYGGSATITITDGTIVASGDNADGAGIGSGFVSTGDTTITISGGNITAIGGVYGSAGIGAAPSSSGNLTITITGGSITASSEATEDSPDINGTYTAQAIGTSQYATGLVSITIGSTIYDQYHYDDNVEYSYLSASGEEVVFTANYVELVIVSEVELAIVSEDEESTTGESVIIVDTSTH